MSEAELEQRQDGETVRATGWRAEGASPANGHGARSCHPGRGGGPDQPDRAAAGARSLPRRSAPRLLMRRLCSTPLLWAEGRLKGKERALSVSMRGARAPTRHTHQAVCGTLHGICPPVSQRVTNSCESQAMPKQVTAAGRGLLADPPQRSQCCERQL